MDREPKYLRTSQATHDLAPEIMAVFDRGTIRYDVSLSDVLLGQLKRDRQYRVRNVFLSTSLFTADFAADLAVFLHEHAHIFDYDGDRGFTDALTELIEAVIRHRDVFDRSARRGPRHLHPVDGDGPPGHLGVQSASGTHGPRCPRAGQIVGRWPNGIEHDRSTGAKQGPRPVLAELAAWIDPGPDSDGSRVAGKKPSCTPCPGPI